MAAMPSAVVTAHPRAPLCSNKTPISARPTRAGHENRMPAAKPNKPAQKPTPAVAAAADAAAVGALAADAAAAAAITVLMFTFLCAPQRVN